MEQKRPIIVDYVTVRRQIRVSVEKDLDRLCLAFAPSTEWRSFPNILDCHDLSVAERRGCQRARKLGPSLFVLYYGSPYIWLEAKGQGCRTIERSEVFDGSDGIESGWRRFLDWLLSEGNTYRRLDLAIDDHDRLLQLPMIREKARNEGTERTGRLRGPYGHLADDDQPVVFGIKQSGKPSNTSIRIYDKAMQQQASGHWVRLELQTRGILAQRLSENFAGGGSALVRSQINALICFRDRVPKKRGEGLKYVPSEWWRAFLNEPPAFQRRVEGDPPSALESLVSSLGNSYGATLAVLLALPDGVEFLGDIIRKGRDKTKPHQSEELRAWIVEHQHKGVEKLDLDKLEESLAELVGPWLYILQEANSHQVRASKLLHLSRFAADRLGMTVERTHEGEVVKYRTIKEGSSGATFGISGTVKQSETDD